MAIDKIKNNDIKQTIYTFNNLTQYNPASYYFYIGDLLTKLGLPSNALLISCNVYGWNSLGTYLSVNLSDNNQLLVFYTNGWAISAASYVTVRFQYILT